MKVSHRFWSLSYWLDNDAARILYLAVWIVLTLGMIVVYADVFIWRP